MVHGPEILAYAGEDTKAYVDGGDSRDVRPNLPYLVIQCGGAEFAFIPGDGPDSAAQVTAATVTGALAIAQAAEAWADRLAELAARNATARDESTAFLPEGWIG